MGRDNRKQACSIEVSTLWENNVKQLVAWLGEMWHGRILPGWYTNIAATCLLFNTKLKRGMVEARNSDGNIKNDTIAEVQSHKSWLVITVFT
jgi:hypothetical protein